MVVVVRKGGWDEGLVIDGEGERGRGRVCGEAIPPFLPPVTELCFSHGEPREAWRGGIDFFV